jgi:HPt (histidine-containing phosphotransfer) domain-containing protein
MSPPDKVAEYFAASSNLLDSMKGIAVPQSPIDLTHLSEQTLGDRHLERELLCLFSAQSPRLLAQMRALRLTEAGTLNDLAHRLKGSARAIGAFGVAAAAETVESNAATHDGHVPLAALAEALEEALAAIASRLQDLESAALPADPPAAGPHRR